MKVAFDFDHSIFQTRRDLCPRQRSLHEDGHGRAAQDLVGDTAEEQPRQAMPTVDTPLREAACLLAHSHIGGAPGRG